VPADGDKATPAARRVSVVGRAVPGPLPEATLTDLRALCASPGVVTVVNEVVVGAGMMGNADYFVLEHAERICSPGYVPSDTDLVNMRKVTQHLEFITVPLPASLGEGAIRFHDVPGQKSKFKQWDVLKKFEKVDLVLFVSSLANYNLRVDEVGDVDVLRTMDDGSFSNKNAVTDSLTVFADVMGARFPGRPVILFMNMTDLFAKKLLLSPLNEHFAAYGDPRGDGAGSPADVEAAQKFLAAKFEGVMGQLGGTLDTHFTCATDKGKMDPILERLLAGIVRKRVVAAGL